MSISRRDLALGLMGLASAEELAAAWQHAHDAAAGGTKLEYLSAADASEIEALVSQIIPSDDTPGAKEAGAVYFIDRALASWDRGQREVYRAGLADLQQRRRAAFPLSASIAGLASEQAVALLQGIETTPFFEALRTHTILGFSGPPSYGGNRGKVGWTHIGVEDKMIFEPPFGYYDAEGTR
ncbi:MAG: gluconate 2-dehydrogenase subunit 3 family protein [Acidobacteria bacterium]|nr:gluconate 2-dehydrogenase subunit 3 family protein [Acidobacteriota bacterium]